MKDNASSLVVDVEAARLEAEAEQAARLEAEAAEAARLKAEAEAAVETPNRNRTLLIILIVLVAAAILGSALWNAKQASRNPGTNNVEQSQVNQLNDENEVSNPKPIRIPGVGSQLDYGVTPFSKVIVHDDESANAAGYFDRTVENTSDPNAIGMDNQFAVPEGWTVERDFSVLNNKFVDYMTVKPLVSESAEAIRDWATSFGFKEGISYEITSVILIDGQECSIRGLDANRVRTNVYVGENWVFQVCNMK